MKLTLLHALALSASPAFAATIYKTQSLCTTQLGAKSTSSVKTTSYALTIPVLFTKKVTFTSTSTHTPQTTTITTTTTQTSTSTITSSPTSTTTVIDYTTTTNTIFETSTSTETDSTTTTTTPPASTIPTSAGFTPLASATNYVAKKKRSGDLIESPPSIKGRSPNLSEHALLNARSASRCRLPVIGGNGQFSPARYPTAVTCGALIEAISTKTQTYTAKTVVTTTAPIPSVTTTLTTQTTVTTITSLDTVYIPVTSISTITTSTTSTITSVTTTTTTYTVAASTPTVYAACAANNAISSANGGLQIYDVQYDYDVQINQNSDTNPTDCCVTCQNTANCVGYTQYPGGSCYYYTSSQCNGAQEGGVFYETMNIGVTGYIIGNGNCGQLANL